MPNEGKSAIWVPFATGVLGALLGGLVQYYATRSLETEKQLLQIQLTAYADFARAETLATLFPLEPPAQPAEGHPGEVKKGENADRAKIELYASEVEKKKWEFINKARDASFRIVIFSPVSVVQALSSLIKEQIPRPPCWKVTRRSRYTRV